MKSGRTLSDLAAEIDRQAKAKQDFIAPTPKLTLVPGLEIRFEPNLTRADLPTASKIFDKAVTEVRPYLDADVHFDRTNTDRDLSPAVRAAAMDLAPFVESRLRAEMPRVAHRR